MSISTLCPSSTPVSDDGTMNPPYPRSDGPRRRTFTPDQKLAHLTAYEQACRQQQGGAYLRRQGLYSSLITRMAQTARCRCLGGKETRSGGREAEQGSG